MLCAFGKTIWPNLVKGMYIHTYVLELFLPSNLKSNANYILIVLIYFNYSFLNITSRFLAALDQPQKQPVQEHHDDKKTIDGKQFLNSICCKSV